MNEAVTRGIILALRKKFPEEHISIRQEIEQYQSGKWVEKWRLYISELVIEDFDSAHAMMKFITAMLASKRIVILKKIPA